MHETQKQDCHCIQGIHCEVKNCVYHQKDDKCEAGKITVGPTFAVSSADTICSTFKAK
ncbi:DUF1540 domain-containing protein [Solibaculum mannosilyticum]|uniref:DUF1540 domain-containing protein n=1 Tax=Solibaculum mannosilyticum TaxID=2780922 RepID=A0A7I8D6I2_9FIRM|nr:DUF1540 domain-containing protein [Solibaculum mannosilyticum]MCO7136668.1 DUF1540 domain-containing protein [[Clostridium] leptum]BCI61089.1 hypothetical protein C12CBH8_17280 [Solibaculum mannosilyticum]CZT55601.1 hypothetical protein BN3661_00681 [Eubacteriaceae bacterium CHKCI005]